MAKTEKPAKSSRKITLGRREKLVAIGALGLVAIGAIHFLVFKPRVDRVEAARAEFEATEPEYLQSQGHNFEARRVELYRETTDQYTQQLLEIVRRERFSMNEVMATPEAAAEQFRRRVTRLTRKWTTYAQTHGEGDGTLLSFIGQQDPANNPRDQETIRAGRWRWNLPQALPPNVTGSVIRDALNQARGKYRLIELVQSDPTPHQREFNQQLRSLGIPVELIGADHITNPQRWAWEPYRLVPRGVEIQGPTPDPLDVTVIPTFMPPPPPTILNPSLAPPPSQPPQQWPSLRLPAPNDAFCALAHIDLLLNALYPPPFDEATIERAQQDPANLSPEQRQLYQEWIDQRRTEREGNQQILGLEDLLDVNYDLHLIPYNLALDHVERIVDMAIEEGLTRVLLVKMLREIPFVAPPDPWTPPPPPTPEETQTRAPSGPEGTYGGEPMAMEGEGFIGVEEGGGMAFDQPADQANPDAPAPPSLEDTVAFTAPIYIQVTGDYTRVMQFFLWLSTGDNFYTVEEFAIATQRENGQAFPGLPEGHVVADFWINVPLVVPKIPQTLGQIALAQPAEPAAVAAPAAPASPEAVAPASPEAAAPAAPAV